ncbi:MAG: flagellar protein FlaG [Planctomycetes bacterium]|nr:flagellar protein FlaG [Planctomycetota bacterium]
MQNIQNNIASNLPDISRPLQTEVDRRASKESLDVEELKEDTAKEVTNDEARAAAQEVKQVLEIASSNRLDFVIEQQNDALFLVIREHGSGDVIKQIPSEGIVELQSRIQEIVGIVLDEKA